MGQRDWVQGSVLWVHRRGSPQGRQDLSLPASIPPAGGLGEAGCGLPRKRIPPNGKLKAQAGSQPFAPSPHTQVAPAPTHNLGFYCADRGTLLQDEVVFFVVAFRRVLFFPPLDRVWFTTSCGNNYKWSPKNETRDASALCWLGSAPAPALTSKPRELGAARPQLYTASAALDSKQAGRDGQGTGIGVGRGSSQGMGSSCCGLLSAVVAQLRLHG